MFREVVEETNYTKSFRDEYIKDILESIPDPITDEEREQLLKLLDMKWILGLFFYKEAFKMFREVVEETNYTKTFRDEFVESALEVLGPEELTDEELDELSKLFAIK